MSDNELDMPHAAEDEDEADGPSAVPPALEDVDLATVEAILFTTDTALSPSKIAEVADLAGGRRAVRAAVERLNERYATMGCAFRVEPVAGGYRMLTLPEFNEVLSRLLKVRSAAKLSQAALETLAVVAYKQPILRADIEAVRGVASGEMLRSLMEKGLVRIVGRAEEIGRPMLYGTTRQFLEAFGMNSLKDLPKIDELAVGAAAPKTPPPPAEGGAENGAVGPDTDSADPDDCVNAP